MGLCDCDRDQESESLLLVCAEACKDKVNGQKAVFRKQLEKLGSGMCALRSRLRPRRAAPPVSQISDGCPMVRRGGQQGGGLRKMRCITLATRP